MDLNSKPVDEVNIRDFIEKKYNIDQAMKAQASLALEMDRRRVLEKKYAELLAVSKKKGKYKVAVNLLIVFSLVLSGVTVFLFTVNPEQFYKMLDDGVVRVGLPIFVASVYGLLFSLWDSRSSSFIDIDNKSERDRLNLSELKAAIAMAKAEAQAPESRAKDLPVRPVENAVPADAQGTVSISDTYSGEIVPPSIVTDRFEAYVREVIASLDNQISLSERKSSTLLDRGTSYIVGGIIFYVVSVLFWQVILVFTELSTKTILGMLSCSLTFLVIEFLAAWFLRQYRSYVDAAANYVRVRSVFNRYLLCYLGMKEFAQDDAAGLTKMRAELLKVLSQEIKWPEVKSGKNGDFNHMMEMFESLTAFVDKARHLVRPGKTEKTAARSADA